MAQAPWYPVGALQSVKELETAFNIQCRYTGENLPLYLCCTHYHVNLDKRKISITKLELVPTDLFSDKNIYPSGAPYGRKLNFHQYNLLGRGGVMNEYAFLNYFHAYAYVLQVDAKSPLSEQTA